MCSTTSTHETKSIFVAVEKKTGICLITTNQYHGGWLTVPQLTWTHVVALPPSSSFSVLSAVSAAPSLLEMRRSAHLSNTFVRQTERNINNNRNNNYFSIFAACMMYMMNLNRNTSHGNARKDIVVTHRRLLVTAVVHIHSWTATAVVVQYSIAHKPPNDVTLKIKNMPSQTNEKTKPGIIRSISSRMYLPPRSTQGGERPAIRAPTSAG